MCQKRTLAFFQIINISERSVGHTSEKPGVVLFCYHRLEGKGGLFFVYSGPYIMLAAKLKMNPVLTIEEAVKEINEPKDEIQKQVPTVEWCFMKPDIKT